MKLQTILTISVVIIAAVLTAFVYNRLPSSVPSHWNAIGEVDSYMKRDSHILLFSGLIIGLPLLLTFLPKIDPKYSNIQKFEGDFAWFIAVFTGFMVALYVYVTAYALGYKLPIQQFMIPSLSVLFFNIGVMLKNTKSNYTIGIRVPWTLHSEKNWDLTHIVAAKSFKYGATIMLLTLLLGNYAFVGFMLVILGMVMVPIVYSYQLHKKGI